jgi:hypothetical protein
MTVPGWLRSSLAGLAGGMAWYVGMLLVFGSVQGILNDPNLQSAKMLAVFQNLPSPRSSGNPEIILIGLAIIGIVWGWVYAIVARAWRVVWWQRGARFAALAWALMVPWFEFYLPWNVLLEPAPLVALELLCWAVVMLLVGLTIAGIETFLARFGSPEKS